MEDNKTFPCPNCKKEISESFTFCPYCRKHLKDAPLSTSVGKQIGLYLLSFFLPPFGLIPAYKYFHAKDPKVNMIGIVAIFLTAISLATSTYYLMAIINQLGPVMKSVDALKQMQGY